MKKFCDILPFLPKYNLDLRSYGQLLSLFCIHDQFAPSTINNLTTLFADSNHKNKQFFFVFFVQIPKLA